MFPARTSANEGTRPSSVESDPNHAPVPPAGPAPNHFSNVCPGPPVMRASLYPLGNRPAPDDVFESTLWPPPVDILEPADNSCQQGGRITSPRPSDKEQQACQMHMSIFDIAGLTSPKYIATRTVFPSSPPHLSIPAGINLSHLRHLTTSSCVTVTFSRFTRRCVRAGTTLVQNCPVPPLNASSNGASLFFPSWCTSRLWQW
jgi:hypothetical protein